MSLSIRESIVTDNQIIANELNNFFVSIGPKLARDLSRDINPLSYVNKVVNSICHANNHNTRSKEYYLI